MADLVDWEDGSSSSSTPTATRTTPPASKKRKRTNPAAEELEIDLSAPEPPSKKHLRKLKRTGLVKTETSSSLANSPRTEAPNPDAPAEKSSTRSAYGIWIGNLPFTATKDDLKGFLTGHDTIAESDITRIHLPLEQLATPKTPKKVAPQNKGFAYVDFSSESGFKAALLFSETLLRGRRVLIKDAKSFEGRPSQPKEKVDNAKAQPRSLSSSKIFVGNLAFDATEEDLRNHFRPCGGIDTIHIATFQDSGKCKGFAWVCFETAEAAQAAVKGWVKMESQGLDEENEASQSGEDGKNESKKSQSSVKKRKWWVNQMRGRPLRMEFAEDDATRYKKRFSKGGMATKSAEVSIGEKPPGPDAQLDGDAEERSEGTSMLPVTEGTAEYSQSKLLKGSASTRRSKSGVTDTESVRPTVNKGGVPAVMPSDRLTGNLVPYTGKKTVFT
ncbi:MAG: hypothetical protein M1833_005141 [Piccolia ochrophora]|nr:MAG: hypothetical protein M1833_005141 [Piccolia ochrophora]